MTASHARTRLLLLIAGALCPLALAPLSIWPAAIISVAILFCQLENQTATQAWFKATIYGVGLFGAGASWVYVGMYEHGDVSMAFAVLGTILFCAFFACLFAIPFALAALMPQSTTCWLWGLPAIWVLSEWFRSWVLTGFPWLYAGYSHTDTWLNGWAPVGGVFLLSYITAFAAALLAQALQKRLSLSVMIASACLLAAVVGGKILQGTAWTVPSAKPLSVVLLQPNVDQKDRWAPKKRNETLDDLLAQTEPYWGTEIIIWPEGAIPALKAQVIDYLMALDKRGKSSQTALIIGIPTHTIIGDYHNSMLALGDAVGQYDKTRLVPFGEYVPFESLVRGLNRFFDLPMSSFSLGAKDQPTLTVKGQPLATAICYEIVYPNLVAKNTRKASMMLTVSNDAWFGNSIAPQQHMQMARMRAIENAKPLMRGTNNGITALVDHRGQIVSQLEQFRRGELRGTLEPRSGQTPFAQFASWPIVVISLILCAGLVLAGLRRRKKEEN